MHFKESSLLSNSTQDSLNTAAESDIKEKLREWMNTQCEKKIIEEF